MRNRIACAYLVVLVLLLSGCGKKPNDTKQFDPPPLEIASLVGSLKVGMTYEEVEKVCGKPSAIERGCSQLAYSSDQDVLTQASNEDVQFLKAVVDTVRDANYWVFRKHVETTGQFLYVRWVYDKWSRDTFFVWKRSVVTAQVKLPIEKYYVNKQEVSKKAYDAAENVTSKYTDIDHVETKTKIVSSSAFKEVYGVTNRLCVLFDASSGRVVQSGFQPFSVSEIK